MLGTGIRAGRRMALRGALAVALLAGLCAAAQANTTAPLAQNATDGAPLLGPPTGTTVPTAPLTAPTAPAAPIAPAAPMAPAAPAPGTIIPTIPAAPAPSVTPQAPAAPAPPAAQLTPAPLRMALLLPLRSPTLGTVAAALRDGVLAGHEREPAGVALEVLESGDTPQDVVPAYAAAVERFDIVIGPLSRSDVAAVAQSGKVTRPTIALSPSQGAGAEAELALPPSMLLAGLSLEEEARQVADWIAADSPGAVTFVLATDVAWQQRTARAFAARARGAGLAAQSMTVAAVGANLDPGALVQLRQRIAAEQPQALFVALDAQQALQLRTAIGDAVPLYGTSQLNPLAQADWADAEPVPGLDGARLVDIPWQLQRDHPAVMVYPHSIDAGKRSAVRERLYALGIDAYRVAREVGAGRTDFSLDGVTGRLTVRFGSGGASFERVETQAIYRDGRVQPLAGP